MRDLSQACPWCKAAAGVACRDGCASDLDEEDVSRRYEDTEAADVDLLAGLTVAMLLVAAIAAMYFRFHFDPRVAIGLPVTAGFGVSEFLRRRREARREARRRQAGGSRPRGA